MHKVHMHAGAIMQLLYGLSSSTYVWGAVLVFIPYLWISINHLYHLWISIIHIRIYINEFWIYINHFWMSINQLNIGYP